MSAEIAYAAAENLTAVLTCFGRKGDRIVDPGAPRR